MTKKQWKLELKDPRWHLVRFRIGLERGAHCERCDNLGPQDLNVHHKFYDGRHAWEYSDNELELLCRRCHELHHIKYNPKKKAKVTRSEVVPEGTFLIGGVLSLSADSIVSQYQRWYKSDIREITDLNHYCEIALTEIKNQDEQINLLWDQLRESYNGSDRLQKRLDELAESAEWAMDKYKSTEEWKETEARAHALLWGLQH